MKVKKILAAVMAAIVVGGTISIEPPKAMNTEITTYATGTYDYFEYENYGNYIEITKYTGSDTEVVIPDNIDGIPVTALADGREYSINSSHAIFFQQCTELIQKIFLCHHSYPFYFLYKKTAHY